MDMQGILIKKGPDGELRADRTEMRDMQDVIIESGIRGLKSLKVCGLDGFEGLLLGYLEPMMVGSAVTGFVR